MSERKSVELKHPIEVDGVRVSVLHLRRPKVRDRLAAEKAGSTDAEQEIAMIAALADMTPSNLHELDLIDYKAVSEAFTGFFSSAQTKSGD